MDRFGAHGSTPTAAQQLSSRSRLLRASPLPLQPLAAPQPQPPTRPRRARIVALAAAAAQQQHHHLQQQQQPLLLPRAAAPAPARRRGGGGGRAGCPPAPPRSSTVPLAVAMSGRDSFAGAAAAAAYSNGYSTGGGGGALDALQIEIDNDVEPGFTTIRVEGRGQGDALLAALGSSLQQFGINVNSAAQQSEDGQIFSVFKVTAAGGGKVPQDRWDEVRREVQNLASSTKTSNQPAIYGMVAGAEAERLRGEVPAGISTGDAVMLELSAAEMAAAAAEFVALEKDVEKLREAGADAGLIALKDSARQEAAAQLERKMAAMEACLAARRVVRPTIEVEAPRTAAALMEEQMKAAVAAPPSASTGPAAGSGREMLLQAFNWESHKRPWYRDCMAMVPEWAKMGFTAIWLPPPSDAVSPQGYLPRDLYCLDSEYGSEADLRQLISVCHDHGIKAIADIVINHRCATYQSPDGKWNKYGGRLAWDAGVICNNNPAWGGRGGHKTGDDYPAAPNIDHAQERVQRDVIEWLQYLRQSIGFDGWRFDYVRGYSGAFAKIYTDATVPEMAFGEYWDTCEYTDGVLNYNQDAHRQRTCNWCDASGGTNAAFDFTTKGILQEALGRSELWRLVDASGRPPGFVGMWPSRAITFLDNHDTGSTLNHWPFPSHHLQEGYAYILTHPGTPCVFYDHLYLGDAGLRQAVLDLIDCRQRHGIDCRAKVTVRKAAGDVYAATVNDRIAVKIGRGDWSPNTARIEAPGATRWTKACSGHNWAVWEADP